MKRIDYFWARVICQITGIVFITQLIAELSGVVERKQGFEWVLPACAVAFVASVIFSATLIVINALRKP